MDVACGPRSYGLWLKPFTSLKHPKSKHTQFARNCYVALAAVNAEHMDQGQPPPHNLPSLPLPPGMFGFGASPFGALLGNNGGVSVLPFIPPPLPISMMAGGLLNPFMFMPPLPTLPGQLPVRGVH